MSKIVMCVPTYNHPDTVEDVLKRCVKDYYDCGIDIYYFDGSEEDDTENVIKEFIQAGYSNLHYYRKKVSLNERLIMIANGEGLPDECEYLWISKERSFCDKHTLDRILSAAEKGYDAIILNVLAASITQDLIYDSDINFYKDWAWITTSMDVSIVNRKTVFNEHCAKKYFSNFGMHYSVLFGGLSELHKKSILIMSGDVMIRNSTLSSSTWENRIFEVWGNDWIEANESLPKVYDPVKDKVIRDGAGIPWILGTIPRLIELHDKGILIEDKLPEIRKIWPRLSLIPLDVIEKIAKGQYDYKHDLSVICKSESESFELLKKMTEMVGNNLMDKQLIPFENLKAIIENDLRKSHKSASISNGLVLGSIEDLLELIKEQDFCPEDNAKLMQIVVLLFYFGLQ